MGKLEKSFFWLCFVLGIYAIVGFKLIPIILKDQIIKNLDENLTQKATIGKIQFNPFNISTIIHDFKISDTNEQSTISFKEFSIDFALLKSIEKQHISIKYITLKDASINILEEKDGNLNLVKLIKPSLNQEKKEEKNSPFDIKFLVSKIVLDNANIKYSNQDEIPYSLDLKNINYTLYDVGTYKNILSSNDLKFTLNQNTNITIGGAFKLEPFKAYGKVSIEDLRLKDLITYKKDLLNFDLDEKANLNLELNYNLDTTNNLDLQLNTDKFELNNLNLTQDKTALLNLEKINIKTFDFDLQKQNINLDNIDFNSLKANLILNKDGTNFANLIHQRTMKNKPEAKDLTKKEEITSKPWNINLSKVRLNNSDFIFTDKINNSITQSKDFNINFNNLKIINSDIELDTLVLNNLNLNFEDKTNNIELSAKDIQLHINNLINKKNDLSINFIKLFEPKLDFLNTNDKTKIIVKNLDLEIQKLSNNKNGFKISKTNLNKPDISIILAKKNIQIKDKNTINSDSKELKDLEKEENNTSKINLDIGPVNITNGIFSFEDKNLPIPFKTTVTRLNGKISEFKNTKSSTTNLEVKGVVDEYGIAKITGVVHPNNIKLLTDINMIFNNIAINNFTPYSGKFVGRQIKSGKLDLDLKYNIEKSNLEAKNNIVISKLELGEKIESPDAVSLPLDIAVSLLKDSNGIININLPISGNVDDPQFAIGSIIWKAFINLMTKAVTAPFSLLSSMFNFTEDEISSVKFNPLEDEVGPIQKETLDKISQILKARSKIAIELLPSYEENKEGYAQQKQNYLARKDDDRNLKPEEIEALILKEKIKIPNLEKIAKNRIINISNYLVKEKGINPKQIVMTDKIENNSSAINLNISKK
ncbi:MAG: DUF748 domain-containing protein [Aliarcobacter sp.]|nr:DUF748 domain-containing protein [Aliarcobacter sp.]